MSNVTFCKCGTVLLSTEGYSLAQCSPPAQAKSISGPFRIYGMNHDTINLCYLFDVSSNDVRTINLTLRIK